MRIAQNGRNDYQRRTCCRLWRLLQGAFLHRTYRTARAENIEQKNARYLERQCRKYRGCKREKVGNCKAAIIADFDAGINVLHEYAKDKR